MPSYSGAAQGAAAGSVLGPWGALAGGVLGGLFGGGSKKPQSLVPDDLKGLRGQNIDLLSAFLKPGAFDAYGTGTRFFYGSGPNAVNNFLSDASPESMAYHKSLDVLSGMLTGTGPQFEQDISMANAQGGRFGSANAILRGEALRNLFNARTQTAGAIGALTGQRFGQLQDVQSQRLQLLAGLIGMSNQLTNVPVQAPDTGGGFTDIAKLFLAAQNARGGGGNSTPYIGQAPPTLRLPPLFP